MDTHYCTECGTDGDSDYTTEKGHRPDVRIECVYHEWK